jgi:hypothetical protein
MSWTPDESRFDFCGRVTSFSLLHNVQTCCGAHSASYKTGKAVGGVKLITHLQLAPRLSMAELNLHSPHMFSRTNAYLTKLRNSFTFLSWNERMLAILSFLLHGGKYLEQNVWACAWCISTQNTVSLAEMMPWISLASDFADQLCRYSKPHFAKLYIQHTKLHFSSSVLYGKKRLTKILGGLRILCRIFIHRWDNHCICALVLCFHVRLPDL